MNEIKLFRNPEFGEVRVVEKEGEAWFVAIDVCRVLDIQNHKDAVRRLDNDEKLGVVLTDPHGRPQETNCINEPGLYTLVLRSRKPEAKAFKRWITHDVIPSIRKSGVYMTPELAKGTLNGLRNELVMLTKSFIEERATRIALEEKTGYNNPENVLSDAIVAYKSPILVGDLAKLLRKNGIEIGRNELFQWLRENGYLYLYDYCHNFPTQKSMVNGLFQFVEGENKYYRSIRVSAKGQEYFVNLFMGNIKKNT